MNRSYKHTPVCKGCKSKKYGKRCANRKIRRGAKRKPYDSAARKSNLYRKKYESWDICDYRLWREESWLNLRDCPEIRQKFYRRK